MNDVVFTRKHALLFMLLGFLSGALMGLVVGASLEYQSLIEKWELEQHANAAAHV